MSDENKLPSDSEVKQLILKHILLWVVDTDFQEDLAERVWDEFEIPDDWNDEAIASWDKALSEQFNRLWTEVQQAVVTRIEQFKNATGSVLHRWLIINYFDHYMTGVSVCKVGVFTTQELQALAACDYPETDEEQAKFTSEEFTILEAIHFGVDEPPFCPSGLLADQPWVICGEENVLICIPLDEKGNVS